MLYYITTFVVRRNTNTGNNKLHKSTFKVLKQAETSLPSTCNFRMLYSEQMMVYLLAATSLTHFLATHFTNCCHLLQLQVLT